MGLRSPVGSLTGTWIISPQGYTMDTVIPLLPDWILDNIPIIIFSVIVGSAILIPIMLYFTNKGLPPGPIGLPFFGVYPVLNEKNCTAYLGSWKKNFGDFYSFKCVGNLYLSLGSFKAVREAHVAKSEFFGGRYEEYNLLTAIFADGVGFVNGEPWRVLRKYFLQVFKERGMLSANDYVSSSIYESVQATVDELKEKAGQPVDIVQLLTDKCMTVAKLIMFGEDGVTDGQIREINEHYAGIMVAQTSTNLLLTGNLARYVILPLTPGYRKFKKSQALCENLLFKIINEHKATYNEDNVRDVIDEYIRERNERQSKQDPSYKHFTDKALVSTLVQIVGDGVLSLATFIVVYIKMVLDHPEEQDKIYKEVVEVVGTDRLPTAEDKSKLVYTNAFLMEGMRTNDFFPFFPSMQCTKETTIRGYRIPKGTITLMNLWSAHNDPEVYHEPEKFDPSRYLERDGHKRPELPITFGVGKRACVGEGYVMLQVFLFLTSLIQNFHIRLQNDEEHDIMELLYNGKLRILVEPRN
ncbi:hypothetical protein JTE90_025991 [Oedothorax gibbosus]|uniref:Cytochrome P450 n=1 Tax=Oedothorax gibbosus TaxID=931172 RepID=A0AAV6UGQ1_9ARAC|nr:hypothetical protein JTE90_025991 [Oedothorax gibbosus]